MFWGVFFFGHETCGILAPLPGIEPVPSALEDELLTTGLPGKSHDFFLKKEKKPTYSFLGCNSFCVLTLHQHLEVLVTV